MIIRRNTLILCSTFWTLAAAVQPALAATPLAALLPEGTKAYLATPDVRRLDERWHQTQFAAMFDDQHMEGFVDSLISATRLLPKSKLPGYGLGWDDLLSIASGEACWAAAPAGDAKSGFLLLVQVAEKQPETDRVLERLEKLYAEHGAQRVKRTIGGSKVLQFDVTVHEPAETLHRFYIRRSDLLAVTDREELAADLIQRLDGKKLPSLADLEAFGAIERQSRAAAADHEIDVAWYLDPFGYDQMVRRSNGDKPDETIESLREQGFDVIRGVGGVASFSVDEHDLIHHYTVHVGGPYAKATRLLDFLPVADFGLPEWIPADVGSATVFGWNLASALLGYGSWFDASYAEGIEGTFEDVLVEIRDEKGGPQVDVRQELIQQLEGPLVQISDVSQSADGRRDQVLYAARARDPVVVARAVRRMLEGDPEVRRSTVGDHVVWVFQPVADQNENDLPPLGPDLSNYAVSVANGFLFVATDVRLLTKVLDGKAAETASPDFQQALQKLKQRQPADMISWHFSRRNKAFWATYDQLRSGQADSGTLQGSLLLRLFGRPAEKTDGRANTQTPRIDFTRLPEFETIKGYWKPSYGFVTSDGGSLRTSVYVTR